MPTDPDSLDTSVAAVEADDAKLQADIADLATVDESGPKRRRRTTSNADTPEPTDTPEVEETPDVEEDGPDESNVLRMPAQWTHPNGPWGDAPAQSRFN